MTETDPRDRSAMSLGFGAYQIVRPLRSCGAIERYLVADPERQTHHVAFRLPLPDGCDRGLFLDAVSRSSCVNCPHVLSVDQFAFAGGEAAWIISPYTGDHDGLLLLSDLLEDKGGQFEALEVRRVLSQLIAGLGSIHSTCGPHGRLTLGCIQVDRSGKLLIELPALKLIGNDRSEEAERDEVRSLVGIAYELLTGVAPGAAGEQIIVPSRLINGLSPSWDRFVLDGLDPVGGHASLDVLAGALERVFEDSPLVEVRTKRTAGRLGLIRRNSGV